MRPNSPDCRICLTVRKSPSKRRFWKNRQQQAFFLGQPDQCLCFGRGGYERFFHDYVFARFEGLPAIIGMSLSGGIDHDQFDIRCEQVVKRANDLYAGIGAPGQVVASFGDDRQFETFVHVEKRCMEHLSRQAERGDSGFDLFHDIWV